jgi:diaminopimelate decarboxylase
VTEVVFTKQGTDKNFCIVDAAMNDLPRPAMYQAYHGIIPCKLPAKPDGIRLAGVPTYDVVGPVCESGDWLGKDRELDVTSGDLLAVLSTGAYCMAMASNYNTRGRAAEVLVDGNTATLIRIRETAEDQMRMERML